MTETWADLVAGADGFAPAVVAASGRLSHGELLGFAASASSWLDRHGAEPGAPVPALLPSNRDAFALALAGALTMRPLAPLNPRATPHEVAVAAAGLPAGVLVAAAAHRDLGRRVAERTGRRLCVLDDLEPRGNGKLNWRMPADAPVAIVHTSGTTGHPKPVILRQDRLAARTHCFAGLVHFGPGSVFTSGSPFHHIAGIGMLLTAMAAGAAIAEFPGFSNASWRQAEDLRVTHALLVPAMIEKLLDAGHLRIATLRSLQYGGSPIRPETVRRLCAELPGVRLTQLFGQTEGSPITVLTHEHHLLGAGGQPELLATVGTAVPGLELRVDTADERGVGEVLARAPHLFTTDDEGWLHTGDMGTIVDDGFVRLLGRTGDMIIRGGENVYPLEIELVIGAHPMVREVAVVGIPDRRLGEVVQAFIVLATGVPATASTEAELRAHTRDSLSGYKVPVDWRFVSELPRNASGKVLRTRLRAGRSS